MWFCGVCVFGVNSVGYFSSLFLYICCFEFEFVSDVC